ncbi:thiamine pyrophosphate-dependent dehydrogenase E1 component subunit alpha [Chloroflexota bacterium]
MVLDRAALADMYYRMWLIRFFESAAREAYHRDLIRGTTHAYTGQEAIAVGACAALQKDDYITSTHRGHGHCLAKGGSPRAMMAELLGKATGYCKGKGGSMHIADLNLGILGANGIVGGGIGIATGAAYSADLRSTGQVSVCFFGDGASNQGILMEAGNMAALWRLPVIFLCEENQYAEFSPSRPFIALERIEQRALGFGVASATVDGNDVLAVHGAVLQAADRARNRGGPTLVVAQTYRIEGHTVGDPLTYRPKGEVELWKTDERDSISRFARALLNNLGFTQDQLDALAEKAEKEIDEAVDYAVAGPDPEPSALWEDVYA